MVDRAVPENDMGRHSIEVVSICLLGSLTDVDVHSIENASRCFVSHSPTTNFP